MHWNGSCMIVATKMKNNKFNKNEAWAMKGHINKEYPSLQVEVITSPSGDAGIQLGVEKTLIFVHENDFVNEINRYLVMHGYILSFKDTVKKVIDFLRNPSENCLNDSEDYLILTSGRLVKEDHESEIYHSLVFHTARRNAAWTWKPNDVGPESCIVVTSEIWGFQCTVGRDPILGSNVQVRKSDRLQIADYMEKEFIS